MGSASEEAGAGASFEGQVQSMPLASARAACNCRLKASSEGAQSEEAAFAAPDEEKEESPLSPVGFDKHPPTSAAAFLQRPSSQLVSVRLTAVFEDLAGAALHGLLGGRQERPGGGPVGGHWESRGTVFSTTLSA